MPALGAHAAPQPCTAVLPGGWPGSLPWLGRKGLELSAPQRKRLSFQRYRGKDNGRDCPWLSNKEPKEGLALKRCF